MHPKTIAAMVNAAHAEARQSNAHIILVTATVGCLDMPVIAQALLKKKYIDGLVVLGAVAKGATNHDELVVTLTTQAIIQLSLHYNKPVGFGIIGPNALPRHFQSRARPYAQRAVEACVRNLELLSSLLSQK